jgi:hypothetical protein
MSFGTPPAYMGFVGFVRFEFPGSQVVIRATSADPKLMQDITKPDVIDGRFDRSVIALGPQKVEGSVEYPAIMERQGGNEDPTARLYRATVGREITGSRFGQLRNANIFNLATRYTSQFAEFRFKDCIINTWKYSVTQSDMVKINVSLIGRTRESTAIAPMTRTAPGFPTNTRAVTWNDAVVEVLGARGAPNISGDYIRSFEVTYNNNADYYYTLNRQLAPQDIAVKKRDIDGRIVLLGRHEQLSQHAQTNQDRCFEETRIRFGYDLTRDECNSTFLVTIPNVYFRIEELALTNDIFETTVQFHSLPDDLDLEAAAYLTTGGAVT